VVIDTQSDLFHARRMIELFGKVWPGMPKRVINTHEDGDHVWGNQLFEGAEIIAHRTVPDRMRHVADPRESQKLAILGKKMELYAGMMENLDFHVGRLIDHLKKIGEYENTIFIVFGDNGAEGTDLFQMIAGSPGSRDYLFAAIS
jgi:glyoxylase-like metal-dependent hydrolase (beta-lactamase superfamily II)